MQTLRIAVLLGEWSDRRHRFERTDFERAFFSLGTYRDRSPSGMPVYGSVHDCYREMSWGQLAVSGTVFDWVELSGSWEDYRDASFGSPIVQEELMKAVRSRHGDEALDGFDGFAFVWAGNAVRRTSALWPMRIRLGEKAAFKTGETHEGEFLPIGVACHELGHTFGLLDKYGLGATRNPFEEWCLMGKGTHGADPSGRHRPFPLCASCKDKIGWLHPTELDPERSHRLALRPITFGAGEVFRIPLDDRRHLLLEHRGTEGFLTDFQTPGLALIRVGDRVELVRPEQVPEFDFSGIHREDGVLYLEIAPVRGR